nr:4-hydroxy-3-methylbut-2-enyl diphosphate reductase [Lachnospiraceae bacterium]
IRSHGVAKSVKEKIAENKNIRIVDATCPFVKKIHETVEKESGENKDIIIIGDPKHPEVLGITGYVKTRAYVINSREEAEEFSADKDKELCLVSQTTYNLNKFKDLVEILSKKGYSIYVVNTVCSATRERQEEAVKLAGKVDAMIVIGGRHSSNTKKLYELCAGECNNTVLIQTLDDLDLDLTRSFPCVGITAGASTPKFIIEEVQNNVRGTEF